MEDTLASVKAYFESTLPAELTAIGTERGVMVPAYKLIDTSEIKDRQYPMIEILPETMDYDYSTDDEPFLEPIELHAVVVLVTHAGSEYKTVQADLERYAEAIRRITIDDDTYGAKFNWVRLVRAVFLESTEAQRVGELRQALTVELLVRVMR